MSWVQINSQDLGARHSFGRSDGQAETQAFLLQRQLLQAATGLIFKATLANEGFIVDNFLQNEKDCFYM